jgi:endonuclease YncB( thermonuclease family)
VLRHLLAGQVAVLDRHLALLEHWLATTRRQSRLLADLLYAREMDRQPQEDELRDSDWVALLALPGRSQRSPDGLLAQLEAALARWEVLPRGERPAFETAPVKSVPDGDGLKLADGRRVRYLGIDAPEVANYGGSPEPFALEARALNRELVDGRSVRLERDITDCDRYGRLLRYVFVGDIFVNEELVRAGLARAFVCWPDEKYGDALRRAERAACRRRQGMWR